MARVIRSSGLQLRDSARRRDRGWRRPSRSHGLAGETITCVSRSRNSAGILRPRSTSESGSEALAASATTPTTSGSSTWAGDGRRRPSRLPSPLSGPAPQTVVSPHKGPNATGGLVATRRPVAVAPAPSGSVLAEARPGPRRPTHRMVRPSVLTRGWPGLSATIRDWIGRNALILGMADLSVPTRGSVGLNALTRDRSGANPPTRDSVSRSFLIGGMAVRSSLTRGWLGLSSLIRGSGRPGCPIRRSAGRSALIHGRVGRSAPIRGWVGRSAPIRATPVRSSLILGTPVRSFLIRGTGRRSTPIPALAVTRPRHPAPVAAFWWARVTSSPLPVEPTAARTVPQSPALPAARQRRPRPGRPARARRQAPGRAAGSLPAGSRSAGTSWPGPLPARKVLAERRAGGLPVSRPRTESRPARRPSAEELPAARLPLPGAKLRPGRCGQRPKRSRLARPREREVPGRRASA